VWSVTGEVETGRAEVEEKQKRVFTFFPPRLRRLSASGQKTKPGFSSCTLALFPAFRPVERRSKSRRAPSPR